MTKKQKRMEGQMKKFNQKIKEGYKVNWNKTKEEKGKTIITLEK